MPLDYCFDETNYLSIIPRFGIDDANTVPRIYINDYDSSYHDFAEYCIIQLNECSQRRIQNAWRNIIPTTYTFPKSCRHIQITYNPKSMNVTSVDFQETLSPHYTGDRVGPIHDYKYNVQSSISVSAVPELDNS